MKRTRVDVAALAAKKQRGEKITMLTAYDFPTARIFDEAGIDSILVGDSAGNTVLGYRDTIPVTMDEMVLLTKAVARAVKCAFVIGDMPFMSFNVSAEKAIENAGRFMKEGGANAVKLEGGALVEETVRAIVRAGIPVVGHLGLTPQTAPLLGGYRVQGRTAAAARRILDDALLLQQAGVVMIVVECIPSELAKLVCARVGVPVIGIGAGPHCDGQVLVSHDMLGIAGEFAPRFVKRFGGVGAAIAKAAAAFRDEVSSGTFPAPEHSFKMDEAEQRKLLGRSRARRRR